jgi:hypothetical protein
MNRKTASGIDFSKVSLSHLYMLKSGDASREERQAARAEILRRGHAAS